MKKTLFLFCLILYSFSKNIQAQDKQRVDSLLSIYNNEQSADTLKIKVLNQVFIAYMYYDQEEAGHYLSLARDIAVKINNEYEIASCNGNKGILFDILGQPDSSRIYYKKAIAYFEKNNIRDKLELVRFNLGMIELQEGNYDEAIDLVNQNIISPELVMKENAPRQAMSYGLLSRVYRVKGFYQLSLKNALIALKIIETTNDESRIASALRDLANTESGLLHFKKSNEYHLKAIALYEKINDKYFLASSKNDLGSNYIQLKNFPKALEVLKESLALAREVGSIDAETAALNNIGKVYMEQGEFELALKFYQEGITICKNSGYPSRLSGIQFRLGNLYAKWGQHSKAITLFDECIAYADSIERNGFLEDWYMSRAKSNEALGDKNASIGDYKKAHSISIRNYDSKQITAIEELRIIHDLEQKENEITLLAKNAELDEVKKTRLWTMLIAAIGLGSILLWTQWQRRRKEKLLHQKEQEIQVEKNRVAELENQRLNTALDFKKQELTSKVLQLCRKNEFLQSLNKDVKDFKSEFEGSDKNYFDKLSRKINRDMNADSDWEQFLKSFETVHPNFKKILYQEHPSLGTNEIRMAYLMRMNLESKDIANLLNITPDGVKKARYRMRKKLGKDSSVNLTEYFINFGNLEPKKT